MWQRKMERTEPWRKEEEEQERKEGRKMRIHMTQNGGKNIGNRTRSSRNRRGGR